MQKWLKKILTFNIKPETVLKLCFIGALIVSTPHTFELLYKLEHGEEWFRWFKAGAGALVLDLAAGVFLHLAASFVYKLATTVISAIFGVIFGVSIFWINWLYYGPAEWGVAALVPFASIAFSIIWAMLEAGKGVKPLNPQSLTPLEEIKPQLQPIAAMQVNVYHSEHETVSPVEIEQVTIENLPELLNPEIKPHETRRAEIAKLLNEGVKFTKSGLAKQFNVSIPTISKDLEVLSRG